MNLTRLVCLGLLAELGARHGHQLRRDVEVFKADEWAGVGAGSLNRELRQMTADGLIEAVRTERVGRWPERTIYQITSEGRRELAVLRERAIGPIQQTPDAMAAGLIFAGSQDPSALTRLLAQHRQAVEAELQRLAAERERGMREGYLQPSVSPVQAAAFRRSELRMEAELAWHRECDQMLGAAPARKPG
jgi:DNA-binding PadR family transcriptional regulator